MHRRDKSFRPVHYYNINILKGVEYERLQDVYGEAVLQLLAHTHDHCMVPGRVE
jgi:hypothetical protein